MPGLLRGVARTAVIAGTATHVSNNVSRRQQQKWADQDQAAEPQVQPAAAVDTDDQIAQLQKLGELQQAGILTPEEFTAKKQQILGL